MGFPMKRFDFHYKNMPFIEKILHKEWWLAGLVVLLVLPGCTTLTRALQTPTPPASPIATLVLNTIAPSVTNTPPEPAVCAYVLVSKDAPDAAAMLNQAYRSANFSNIDVRAAAYGENCIDTNTNTVVSFSAMQTDVYLAVPVQDIHDEQALGDWIARLVPVIALVPANQLPGPNPGNILVQFTNASGMATLWFPRKTAQDLIQKGVRGSALYEALLAANAP